MKTKRWHAGSLLVFFLLSISVTALADWPSFRGLDTDGTADSGGHFAEDSGGGLKIAWNVPAGSGYSSVSISGNIAVTLFSDGKTDDIAAFDVHTGRELWRTPIAETYKGHDGSHDGPIATPAIFDRKVFALGPRGHVVAVDLLTGKKIWETNLVQQEGVEKPYYGFGTSPLISNGVLVLEAGAKNKFIVGLEPSTGKNLWSLGNDDVRYQSPIRLKWNNREFVVAAGNTKLFGIDASKGKIVWEYAHEGQPCANCSESLVAVPAGQGELLLKNKADSSTLIRLVSAADGKINIEKIWTAPVLKGTYSVPVYYKGYFYGYNGRILSCVDAVNGKIVWRTRAVDDGFLMVVDGNLVIQTKEGSVHMGPASPEGWTERSKVDLASVSWTPPSFSNGAIFARGMKGISRIEWSSQSEYSSGTAMQLSASFQAFLTEIEKSTNKKEVIDRFLSGSKSYPYVESPNHVYFFYRGEANDVGITGDMIGSRKEEPMNHIPGTDLFWYHAELEPDALITYRFVRNFEEPILDPLNANKTKDDRGKEISLFMMPAWKDRSFPTQAPVEKRGTFESAEIVSSSHKQVKVKIDVYLPPGYKTKDEKYPVLFVLDGSNARSEGFFQNAVDHLSGNSIPRLITVFVDPVDLGDLQIRDAASYYDVILPLLREVVKHVDDRYRTKTEPEARAILGSAFTGSDAFLTVLKTPGLFGAVGLQSMFMLSSDEEVVRAAVKTPQEQPLRIYMDWGLYGLRSHNENWSIPEANRRMMQHLRDRGYEPVGGETPEFSGWASWRNRLDRVLTTLFPM